MAQTLRTQTQFSLQILTVHSGNIFTQIQFRTTLLLRVAKWCNFFKKLFPCPHIPGLPCFLQDHKRKSPNPTWQNQAVLHLQRTELEEVLETPRESFWLVWRSSHGKLIKPKCSNQKAFLFPLHIPKLSFAQESPKFPSDAKVPNRGLS